MAEEAPEGADPQPRIGLRTATALIVGSAIGSGIFLLPSQIAQQVPAPGLVLSVWVVGGLLSLFGALTFAEMGAMYPRAGGQYVFLREAYGNGAGFTFGWFNFWVNITGTIAAVAYACAIYLGVFWSFDPFQTKLVAIGVIWFLTLVNWFGVRHGGVVGDLSTIAKVAAILGLVVLGFWLGDGTGQVLTPLLPADVAGGALAVGFGLAMVSVLFAYDGWASVTFVAHEIRDPQRTIPRAALLGTLIVMATYLLANAVYLHVLPLAAVAASERLAFDVAATLFAGPGSVRAGKFLAAAVVLSTFGAANAWILQGPRIYYAMAKDKLFYRGFASLHPKNDTPDFGLLVQAQWASLLVLTGTFESLVVFVTVGLWMFYGLTGAAVFVLRRKRPDAPRPYRTLGYPVVPILFVAASIFVVVNAVVFDTASSIWGVVLALSGVPVYLLVRRHSRARARGAA